MNQLNQFPYKKVLVLGLAKSGLATAEVLFRNNVDLIVNDLSTKKEDPLVKSLETKGIKVVLGSHPIDLLLGVDLIVKNPGIPYKSNLLFEAIKKEIPIITEIELTYQMLNKQDLIGITGSNGKTTTTSLVSQIFKEDKQNSSTAGNIGEVSISVAEKLEENESLLLELSSFQLQGTKHFKPHIAALLNLYEAHLDYHGSFAKYCEAKANIFINQTKEDFLIYNYDDEEVSKVVKSAKATLIPFSIKTTLSSGSWTDGEYIYFKDEQIMKSAEIALVGDHNLSNILAAIAIAKLKEVKNESIKNVLKVFTGVEHRLEYVCTKHERHFYNDSKATNILATEQALKAFDSPTILLAGGLDRGDDFSSLIPFFKNVKMLILFGQTKEKLEVAGMTAGITDIYLVESMKEAVQTAYNQSKETDVILLSPACASWDQYKTFEERGNLFIKNIKELD